MVDLAQTGQVTFTFRCNTQRQVYLVGDFNGWQRTATPMRPGKDGLWSVTLRIPPGSHQFRYFEDGGRWHTDFAAFGLSRNEYGDFNSIVEVDPPIRMRAVPAQAYPYSSAARQ